MSTHVLQGRSEEQAERVTPSNTRLSLLHLRCNTWVELQMQRDEYGKFVTKSGEHRAVRSLRLSDTTWTAMGEMAEELSLTRADLLEQMFRTGLNSLPSNTRLEIESAPSNTRARSNSLPSNTRKNIEQLEDVVAQLRAENTRLLNLVQKLSEVKHLEVVRDSILFSLKLGQQASRYKMVKSTLDQFIQMLRDSV